MQSTDTPQLTTDAPQVTVLDTLRSVALPPRPPFPEPPARTIPLGHDVTYNKGAYDEAHDRLQHHADRAFGDGAA